MERWLKALTTALLLALTNGCSSSGGGLFDIDTGGTDGTDGAPGAGIFGRLLDTAEEPIAGAEVELVDDTNTRIAGPVTTDADGAFELPLPTAGAPDEGTLIVRPPRRPQGQAAVQIPQGARIEVVVSVDDAGGVQVAPVLRAPADAPELPDGGPVPTVLLPLDAEGDSEPFRLQLRGQFQPSRSDLRMVFRPAGRDEPWLLAPGVLRQQGERSLPLQLGRLAEELHGRRIEVRAVAAPAGHLSGVAPLAPAPVGPPAVLSPHPVMCVPVLPGGDRVGDHRLGPDAVIVPGGRNGVLVLRPGDLAPLGVRAGQTVALVGPSGSVALTVDTADTEAMALATAQVSAADGQALGLDLRGRFSGWALSMEE